MGQRFAAREKRLFANGAIGWSPGGPFDCLGPYAKVTNCPVLIMVWIPYPGKESYPAGSVGCGQTKRQDTGLRRTCYATGYADSFFSIPACTKVHGKHVSGFFTNDDNGSPVFIVSEHYKERIPRNPAAGKDAAPMTKPIGIGWNVYLNGKLVDTVFFDADIPAEQVKRSLVEHDGYDPRITVRRSRYKV